MISWRVYLEEQLPRDTQRIRPAMESNGFHHFGSRLMGAGPSTLVRRQRNTRDSDVES